MSDIEHKDTATPDVEELIKANPDVDVETAREAQELLEALRKAGAFPQEYDITSPYERRPLRSHPQKEEVQPD